MQRNKKSHCEEPATASMGGDEAISDCRLPRALRALAMTVFLNAFFTTSSFAGEGTTGDYFSAIGTKFGRGLLNVISSPLEIPCGIADDMVARPAAGFFTGFGKGTVFMLRRILVGVTEVGTFMIPMERTIPPVCQEETPAVE